MPPILACGQCLNWRLYFRYKCSCCYLGQQITMKKSTVDCPKMFRRATKITLEKVNFTDAKETLWSAVKFLWKTEDLLTVIISFFNSKNFTLENFILQGNYSFQNCKNIIVRNSILDSRDAFWESENVLVENCVLTGEYLARHFKNVRFVKCKI